MERASPGLDVVNDNSNSADGHQDDTNHAGHQQTRVEATAPPRLLQILLSSSLVNLRRLVPPPGEVSVAVVSVAAAEEKLGVFDVLQTGGVVHTGGTAGRGGGQAGHRVKTSLSEDSPLSRDILLPHCET